MKKVERKTISISLPAEALAIIDEGARIEGLTRSAFIVKASKGEANKILPFK